MKSIKKVCLSCCLALAMCMCVLFGLANPIKAFADTVEMATPKVEGIVGSKKEQYKNDLFFVGDYNYAPENYTLNYRYYKPAESKEKMPLIIFLHGRGERGSDNDMQLNNAILRPFIEDENSQFYKSMVIAPQCPVKEHNNGWVNMFTDDSLDYHNLDFDKIVESVECKAIVSLIEDTCKKENIDSNRIYLIGLSQGAMATWDLLARHSEMFAAAVPISGVGYVSKAEIYADIPIYAFHGQADTTVPYADATVKMYEAINAYGKGKMHFVTFTDGPHAIWESAIVFKGEGSVPGLQEWLFAQTKEVKKSGCISELDVASMSVVLVPAVLMAAGYVMAKKQKAN